MGDPSVLQDIKNCILQFEYPLANSMNDEELADIFGTSNRCFLISWMLKLLGMYSDVVFGENNKLLGQIMYENGFCTKEQMIPFMEGSLDPLEQFKILQDMFIYIKIIKTPISNGNFKPVSLGEIEDLLKNNVNLFPMYGEIKVLSHKENEANARENETENGECGQSDILRSDVVDIAKLIDEIRSELPNIKSLADNCQGKDDDDEIGQICLDSDSEEICRKCNEYLKKISQFIKDVNTIEEFTRDGQDWWLENEHKASTTHRELLKELCDEICDILRHQQRIKST